MRLGQEITALGVHAQGGESFAAHQDLSQGGLGAVLFVGFCLLMNLTPTVVRRFPPMHQRGAFAGREGLGATTRCFQPSQKASDFGRNAFGVEGSRSQ